MIKWPETILPNLPGADLEAAQDPPLKQAIA